MKTKYLIAFIVFAFVSLALAATNVFDPATAPLPSGKTSYWTYAISIVTPIIVWLVRMLVPKIPTPLLPIATPFVGLALGALLNVVADAHLGWVDMAKAGALAVFVREVTNQAITLQLQKSGKAES